MKHVSHNRNGVNFYETKKHFLLKMFLEGIHETSYDNLTIILETYR
jgi:hypothetical protein